MTTHTIYADSGDGRIRSVSMAYAIARTGANQSIVAGSSVGQFFDGTFYSCHEGFVRFDSSILPDGDIVDSATLSLYGSFDASSQDFDIVASISDWGASLDTGDWISGASLAALTEVARYDTSSGWSTVAYNTLVSDAAFPGQINKTGTTYLVVWSSRHENGDVPSTTPTEYVAYVESDDGGSPDDPRLVVETHAENSETATDGLYLSDDDIRQTEHGALDGLPFDEAALSFALRTEFAADGLYLVDRINEITARIAQEGFEFGQNVLRGQAHIETEGLLIGVDATAGKVGATVVERIVSDGLLLGDNQAIAIEAIVRDGLLLLDRSIREISTIARDAVLVDERQRNIIEIALREGLPLLGLSTREIVDFREDGILLDDRQTRITGLVISDGLLLEEILTSILEALIREGLLVGDSSSPVYVESGAEALVYALLRYMTIVGNETSHIDLVHITPQYSDNWLGATVGWGRIPEVLEG